MPRAAPPRRMPPPRKRIIWLRALPIFVGMMAIVILGQQVVAPMFPNNPVFGNPGWGTSAVAGILGAFLISRFATVTPPPPPSKTQQRKLASAASRARADTTEETEEPETVAARASAGQRRRRRRR